MRNIFNGTILFLFIAALVSCNVYKKLDKRSPATASDSAHLARACSAVFPTKTVDSNTVVSHTGIDSTAYFMHIVDSLVMLEPTTITEIETLYRDTCTSAKLIYAKGYNHGFDIGYNEGRGKPFRDTMRIIKTITIERTINVRRAEMERDEARQELEKKRRQLTGWRSVAVGFIVLFLFLLLVGYYITRKSFKV